MTNQKDDEKDLDLVDEENQMFIDEFEDDNDSLLTNTQYEIPDVADGFINTDGSLIKREDMTHWEIIKAIATENGVKIQEPSSGCHHCYGRGYDGIDSKTKMPFPCRCIFRGRSDAEKESESFYDSNKMNKKFSRNQRRHMAKYLKQQFIHEKRETIRKKKDETHVITEGEGKELSDSQINKILKEYIIKDSFKKTASSLNLTLTAVKKTVKNNREKLEKMKGE